MLKYFRDLQESTMEWNEVWNREQSCGNSLKLGKEKKNKIRKNVLPEQTSPKANKRQHKKINLKKAPS